MPTGPMKTDVRLAPWVSLVPLATLALLAVMTGCAGQPPRPFDAPAPYTKAGFDPQAAVEIAILPPAAVPNFPASDGRLLVERVYAALVEKGYTPINPDFAESRLGDVLPADRTRGAEPASLAALRGALDADGYLEVDVVSVKMVPGVRPAVYRIETRATLVEASSGETVFQQRLPVTYEVEYGADRRLSPGTLDELLRRHVGRLLAGLPARRR